MCGGKPKVDTSYQDQMQRDAEDARLKEEERQTRIREGTAAIDDTFAGFNDQFFGDYLNSYMNYYQPQLDQQVKDANDQLTFALARAGTLNSSIAADGRADLNKAYDNSLAGILSEAQASTDNFRGQVNNEKSALVSTLNATGDSERAANEATARSAQLFQAQPTYNPLGDIFSGVTSGIGAAAYGRQQNEIYDRYNNGPTTSRSSGASRIVR